MYDLDSAFPSRGRERLRSCLLVSILFGIFAGLFSVFGTGFFDVLATVFPQFQRSWTSRMELTVTLTVGAVLGIYSALSRRHLAARPQRHSVVAVKKIIASSTDSTVRHKRRSARALH